MGDLADRVDELIRHYRNDEVIDAFSRELAKVDSIRILVAAAGGRGHQGNSIGILLSLMNDYGFHGAGKTIRVAYIESNVQSKENLKKIAGLLPPGLSIHNPDAYSYKATAFKFEMLTPTPNHGFSRPTDHVKFGFTGGLDLLATSSRNIAKEVNTEYFVALQPLNWEDPFYRVQQCDGNFDEDITAAVTGKPYVFNLLDIDEAVWTKVAKIDEYKKSMPLVKAAFEYAVKNEAHRNKIAFCPCYALDENRILQVPPENVATTLIAAMRRAAVTTGRSAVIVNFGELTFSSQHDQPSSSFERIRKFLGGAKTPWEAPKIVQYEEWVKLTPSERPAHSWPIIKQIYNSWKFRDTILKDDGVADKTLLRHVDDPDVTVASLEDDLANLAATPGQLLLLQVGGAPSIIFDHVFANGTLPAVFEGLGTGAKMLSRGTPFLHLPRYPISRREYGEMRSSGRGTNTVYPNHMGPEQAARCRKVAAAITVGLEAETQNPYAADSEKHRSENNFQSAVNGVSQFVADAYTAGHPLHDYFVAVAAVNGDINNSRLTYAIAELLKHIPIAWQVTVQDESAVAPPPSGPTIPELWTELRNNVSADGNLNIFPGTLNDHPIAEKYLGLLTQVSVDHLKKLELSGTSIAPVDPPGNTDTITVSGAVSLLGFDARVNILFSSVAGRLVAKSRFATSKSWQLPNAPWMGLDNATLDIAAWETPSPLQVAISATASGRPWGVEMQFGDLRGWVLTSKFDTDDKPRMTDLFALFGGANFLYSLPAPLKALELDRFEIVYDPGSSSVQSASVRLITAADNGWQLLPNLLPNLKASSLALVLQISDPGSPTKSTVTGELAADLQLAPGTTLNLTASVPGLLINGVLESSQGSLGDLLAHLGLNINLPAEYSPELGALRFSLDPSAETFSTDMSLTTHWTPTFGSFKPFTLKRIRLSAGRDPNLYGLLSGELMIGGVPVLLAAGYRDGIWRFRGHQEADSVIRISDVAKVLLPDNLQPSGDTSDIVISDLDVLLSTGGGADSEYSCSATFMWSPGGAGDKIFGNLTTTLLIGNSAVDDGARSISGKLTAKWDFHNAPLSVETQFGQDQYVQISYAGFSGRYDFTKKTADIRLGDISLGDMVAKFTSWFTGRPVALEPPWNILNEINLKDFKITVDVEKSAISLSYPTDRTLDIDLVFVKILDISLTYNAEKDDLNHGVRIALGVSGLVVPQSSDTLGDSKQLSWDPCTPGDAPKVPGFGQEFFDLRLLALGQRVSYNSGGFNSVQDAIKSLSALPQPSGDNIPIAATGTDQPHFDKNSNWLVAADFGLIKISDSDKPSGQDYVVDLSIIFNDPNLYGLRLGLSGSQAQVLSGLVLDVLYKKISDTLGVYEIEFELPEAMRTLDFGAMSVTMPVIRLKIYTNGDFLIDLGFPHDKDFSQSFAFQALVPPGVPMLGAGGFYFGMLSEAAAPKLPVTSNGLFKPVTAFGIGLQVGFGRRINKGVFQAELSLLIVGLIEGVIATWHASEKGDPEDGSQYFWLQGTIGIVGTVHGYVDFKIIKASVHIEVHAYVTATYEAYRAMPLELVAGVSVKASLKINAGLFTVRLHFSFRAHIRESLSIGHDAPAPWDGDKLQFRGHYARPLAAPNQLLDEPLHLAALPPDAPPVLQLRALPFTSIVLNDTSDTHFAAAIVALFIDCPDPERADPTATPFEQLCNELLLWLIASFRAQLGVAANRADILANSVSRDDLKDIYEKLTENGGTSLDADSISGFLRSHFEVRISGIDQTKAAEQVATLFPMIPALSLQAPATEGGADIARDFSNYNEVSDKFVAWLEDYFDRLRAQGADADKRANENGPANKRTSAAELVFTDYFALLSRHLVQTARDTLRDYRYPLGTDQSLQDVIQWARDAGCGISLADLLMANESVALDAGKEHHLIVTGVTYQAVAGASIKSIADRWPGVTAGALMASNQERQNLLRVGATASVSGQSHVIGLFDDLARVAEKLGVDPAVLAGDDAFVSRGDLLAPHGTWTMPNLELPVEEGDTLAIVASRAGLSVADLTNDNNGNIADLFLIGDEPVELAIPHLASLPLQVILSDFKRRGILTDLAAIAARSSLHGLRLPTTSGNNTKDAGLYEFTGQQIPLPELIPGSSYTLSLTRKVSDDWINFDVASLSIDMTFDDVDVARINSELHSANTTGVVPQIIELRAASRYRQVPAQFPMRTHAPWHPGSETTLPSLSGAPVDSQNLRIWPLPSGLAAQSEAGRAPFAPQVRVNIGTRQETDGSMTTAGAAAYGWATRVRVTVRQIGDNENSLRHVYSMEGADHHGGGALEAILSQGPSGIGDMIEVIQILYRPGIDSDTPGGLLSDDEDTLRWFITRVNLSNRTNPEPEMMRAELGAEGSTPGNNFENLRLIWEAGITRSGGCYLYYNETAEQRGLPDGLFDSDGKATIDLLIIYKQPADKLARLLPSVDTLITGDAIDTERSVVFAEIVSENISLKQQSDESIEGLANRYQTDAGLIIFNNSMIPLTLGIIVSFSRLIYVSRPESRAPGSSLASIANHFSVEPADIRSLNPDIGDSDDIPILTALRIPPCSHTVASNDTPASITDYYFTDLDSFAADNANVLSLFDSQHEIAVPTGPINRVAVNRQGEAGFELRRQRPDDSSPSGAAGAAAVTLDNLYQYLGFRIAGNSGFATSESGLPIGPTQPEATSDLDENESDIWAYRVVLRYNDFVKPTSAAGLESPNMDREYIGIGHVLQPQFEWRDPFGNRAQSPLENPRLDPDAPLNQPPLLLGYTDRLIGLGGWPGLSAGFSVGGARSEMGQLTVALRFDANRYDDPDTGKDRAKGDLVVIQRILQQLVDVDTNGLPAVTVSISSSLRPTASRALDDQDRQRLQDWIKGIEKSLQALSSGGTAAPVHRLVFSQPLNSQDVNESLLFPLTVSLLLSRDPALVDAQFQGTPAVYRAETQLAPAADEQEPGGIHTLAKQVETVFHVPGKWTWKLATGSAGKPVADNSRNTLWIARFDLGGGNGLRLDLGAAATTFAIPPLSTTLQNEHSVPIYPYSRDTGIEWGSEASLANFDSIDLDKWAESFIEGFENLLAPETASAIHMLDVVLGGDSLLQRLLDAKSSLAASISGTVQPVLQDATTGEPQRKVVSERVHQELLIDLARAYSTDVAVHLPVELNASAEENLIRSYGVYCPKDEAVTHGGFSLDAAKATLSGPDSSDLVFLLKTSNALGTSSVSLDGGYLITHIEHDIHKVGDIDNYEASSWLSFLRPEDAGSSVLLRPFSAPAEIPVPLSAYPVPPSLESQGYESTIEVSRTITQAALWNFHTTIAANRAPQDESIIKVAFNVGQALAASPNDPSLLASLAQFSSVWPELHGDLTTSLRALGPSSPTDSPEVKQALTTVTAYADLVDRVADAWRRQHPALRMTTEPDSLVVQSREYADTYRLKTGVLHLSLQTMRTSADFHLDVAIDDYQAIKTNDQSHPSRSVFVFQTPGQPDSFLTYEESKKISARRLLIRNLDVRDYRNAWSSIAMIRNQHLLADGTTMTDPAFVYQTPDVLFPKPLLPTLENSQPIDIARLAGTSGRLPLQQHMQNFVDQMFGKRPGFSAKLQLEMRYSYELASTLPTVEIPILCIPGQIYECGSPLQTLADGLASAVNEWRQTQNPATEGGRYIVDSQLLTMGTSGDRPHALLNLKSCFLDLEDIAGH